MPTRVVVRVGDVLRCATTGGMVRSSRAVEALGVYVPGIVGTDGRVITPQWPPNTLLHLVHEPGSATVDVVIADPWTAPVMTRVEVVVGYRTNPSARV